MLSVRVTPVVGLPQFTRWSQVVDHIFSAGNHCIAALSVTGENAGSIGRDLVAQLLEEEPESDQKLYQLLFHLQEYATTNGCQLSISSGLFYEGACILAAINGKAVLRRKNKLGVIVEAGEEVVLLQGKAYPQDIFILATEESEQFLAPIELQFAKGFDSDGVITSVVPAVHALEDSSLCALAFVSIEESNDKTQFIPFEDEPLVHIPTEHQPLTAVPEPLVESTAEKTSTKLRVPKLDLSKVRGVVTTIAKLFSSKTYVGAHLSKRVVTALIASVVVLAIIISVISFFALRARAENAKAAALIRPYQEQLVQARATAQTDVLAGRAQAQSVVESLVALETEQAQSSKQVQTAVATTLQQAREVYTELSGKEEFSELPIFYDVRLATSDFVTSMATVQGNQAVFWDSEKKQTVVLNLETKNVFTKKFDQLTALKAISAFEEENTVLLSEGVYQLPLTETAELTKIVEVGDSNRAATLINSFGSYVYVFNPEKRNIYRYAKKSDNTYSEPVGWLQSPLGVQFTDVTSMAIDGDLWVSTRTGVIKKFSSGKASEFTIIGLQEPFATPIWLFTNEASANVYVLEPAKERVVILSKEGSFVREVKSNSLSAATNMFVNENIKKIFAVNGSIVYEIAI